MLISKESSGWLGVAALLILGATDIGLTYLLSSYGGEVCGWGQTETDNAFLLQLSASTVFVGAATIGVVQTQRTSSHKSAWVLFAVSFVVVETVLKLAAAAFPQFFNCW